MSEVQYKARSIDDIKADIVGYEPNIPLNIPPEVMERMAELEAALRPFAEYNWQILLRFAGEEIRMHDIANAMKDARSVLGMDK